ncbi:hypothetical protein SO802_019848 [Lithocarpus litseifolius]|uniref:RNase H type-1 domain-containing protein n=1 Tax=Lithocarpus litseifolius TaxID=425828 RepID=A0AAW2CUU7_9ROSI
MIQATPISMTGRGCDRLTWVDNPKGNFDLKSAYNLAGGSAPSQTFIASWIWKSKTLPRIRTFLWKCAHDSIGVKHCLGRKGVVDDDICPIFRRDPETVLYALRDCSRVKAVWLQLGVKMTNQGFWLTKLQEWLNVNRKDSSSYKPGNPPWKMVYPFALWNLWKCRNNTVFNRKSQNPRLVAEIIQQTLEFMYCVSSPRGPTRSLIKRVRWERPPEGWCKLNTDGAASGFSRRIGITTSFVAELWGLRDGLMLCSNLNTSALVVEVDAKAIVDAFQNVHYENNIVSPVLDDCKQLISRFSRIKFNHCYRQSNCCADVLAKVVADQNSNFIYFECPPVDIRKVFEDDLNGVFLNRLCPKSDVVP